ncbi:MAG: MarR family winged helix-turn-helix transcriptional regulator [Pseudohaliea sp.]
MLAPIPDKPATTLTEGLEPALQISYDVTVVANLMAFAEDRRNAARFGIRTREWRVLGALARLGPLTAADIVRIVRQDKGSVSRAAASLEKRGLLARLENPRHARSPFLWLTRDGKALVDEIWPVFRQQARELTAGLSERERTQLCRLLEKLRLHADGVRSDNTVSAATGRR